MWGRKRVIGALAEDGPVDGVGEVLGALSDGESGGEADRFDASRV